MLSIYWLTNWNAKKKKEKTVGEKVGQEARDAIKRRKKQMDELMGFMG